MMPERTPELSIRNGDMALVCLMPSDIEKIRPVSVLSYRAKSDRFKGSTLTKIKENKYKSTNI